MDKTVAKRVQKAMEVLYTACKQEQAKKREKAKCVGCPANSNLRLCPHHHRSYFAPFRWYMGDIMKEVNVK